MRDPGEGDGKKSWDVREICAPDWSWPWTIAVKAKYPERTINISIGLLVCLLSNEGEPRSPSSQESIQIYMSIDHPFPTQFSRVNTSLYLHCSPISNPVLKSQYKSISLFLTHFHLQIPAHDNALDVLITRNYLDVRRFLIQIEVSQKLFIY